MPGRGDSTIKVGLYAGAGVREYWLVDLIDDVVEVYREPVDGRFTSHHRVEADGTLRSVAVPELVVQVERFL